MSKVSKGETKKVRQYKKKRGKLSRLCCHPSNFRGFLLSRVNRIDVLFPRVPSSFVIYRCEKNYVRRRLHDTFHISPSTASALHHAGLGGGGGGAVLNSNGVPSISVSVQTDPTPTQHALYNGSGNGMAGGQTVLANGHLAGLHGESSGVMDSYMVNRQLRGGESKIF